MERKCLLDYKKSACLFLLVFVVYSVITMTKNCYSAAMAAIVDAGIMTKSETGLIASAFYLVYAPFQIVGGVAADKYSPAKLILFGMTCAGVCNLLIYFVQGYVAMIVIWSVNGICQFGIWPSVFKIVASELSPEHRMKSVFLINFTTSVGYLLSYGIAIFISDWKLNFLISAITLFAGVVFFSLGYFSLQRHMVIDTDNLYAKRKAETRISAKEILSVVIKAGVPLSLFVSIIQSMLNLGVKALAPTMLMQSYKDVTPAIGNALNIILILAGPIGLCISRLSVFKRVNEPAAIAACFAIVLVPLSAVIFVGKLPVALIVAALTFIMLIMSTNGIFFQYISKKFEKFGCVATIIGLNNCMAALGVVLSNYVFARIADSYSWKATAVGWFALSVLSLTAILVMIPIWKKFEKKYLQN